MTAAELAAEYKIHPGQISKLIKAGLPVMGKMGVGTTRRFDPVAVAQWFKVNPLKEPGRPDALAGVGSEDAQDWNSAKIREKVAAAKLKEIQVAEKQKKLLPVADVERFHLQLATAIRNRFSALPSIAPSLVGLQALDIRNELEMQVRQILTELSKL